MTKFNCDVKYIHDFRVLYLIGLRQLKVSDPTGRIRKVNVCDVHKILPSDHSSILDEQVLDRRSNYINDPGILKEVAIIDAFLYENVTDVRFKHK